MITDLGKEREAKTTFTAKRYVDAIRHYMNSMGYSETTESLIEGHLADMILLPPPGRVGVRRVWIESKATRLSLSDRKFVEEVRKYLRQWLVREPRARFDFKVFATELAARRKWDAIFGNDINVEKVVAWLRTGLQADDAADLTSPANLDTVLSFFAESEVVRATGPDLEAAASFKEREGTVAASLRQRAKERLRAMEERSHPNVRKSNLIGNLITFQPPKHYVILKTESKTREEMRAALTGSRDKGTDEPSGPRPGQPRPPPYEPLSKDRILTFKTATVEQDFAPLGAKVLQKLDLDQVFTVQPAALSALHNSAVRSIMGRRGVRQHSGVTYLVAHKDVAEGRSRKIPGPLGREMTVAKAYRKLPPLRKIDEGEELDEEDDEDEEDEQEKEEHGGPELEEQHVETPSASDVRFVKHEGFIVKCRRIWGEYYVQILLYRLYTEDGLSVIVGERARRIDERFRKSLWNRSDTQQRKLRNIAAYLFPKTYGAYGPVDVGYGHPTWMDHFRLEFSGYLTLTTKWTPESVELRQGFMDEFAEAGADADKG